MTWVAWVAFRAGLELGQQVLDPDRSGRLVLDRPEAWVRNRARVVAPVPDTPCMPYMPTLGWFEGSM